MKSNTFTKTILILLSLVFILSIGALSTGILDKYILYSNKQEILKDIRTNGDNFEPNNNPWDAFDLSTHEDTLLSTIDGSGVQLDDDWYEISIAPGYENVTIVLTFTHSAGNIDLALYKGTGNLITI